jgi:hypothetical protein
VFEPDQSCSDRIGLPEWSNAWRKLLVSKPLSINHLEGVSEIGS